MSESSTSQGEAWVGSLIGFVFWIAIIASGLYVYYKKDHADVFLDVSTQPELISGKVSYEGVPVGTGTVHVVVSDAKSKRYVYGTTLPVDQEGWFKKQGPGIFGDSDLCRPLWIFAEFRGSFGESAKTESKEIKDSEVKGKPVEGEATLYLNWRSPLDERVLWGAAASLLVQGFLIKKT